MSLRFFCVCLQYYFYGISTIWVGIAVGFTSMVLALQNENIFLDKLTGLFNRYYLDRISRELMVHPKLAIMMIDMNGFKGINDNFGHSEGDDALVSNSVDEIMEVIDARMYEDKKSYYESTGHDRRRR